MASQTQGIQQLLAAEKRAAEKVSEARKRKLIKLSNFANFIDFFYEKIFEIFNSFQVSKNVLSKLRKKLKMRLKSTDKNASDNSRNLRPK